MKRVKAYNISKGLNYQFKFFVKLVLSHGIRVNVTKSQGFKLISTTPQISNVIFCTSYEKDMYCIHTFGLKTDMLKYITYLKISTMNLNF